jgi:hypothetical protein
LDCQGDGGDVHGAVGVRAKDERERYLNSHKRERLAEREVDVLVRVDRCNSAHARHGVVTSVELKSDRRRKRINTPIRTRAYNHAGTSICTYARTCLQTCYNMLTSTHKHSQPRNPRDKSANKRGPYALEDDQSLRYDQARCQQCHNPASTGWVVTGKNTRVLGKVRMPNETIFCVCKAIDESRASELASLPGTHRRVHACAKWTQAR